ncbi:hypothetical protein UlMin_000304 [Ulmus minor]
MNILVWNVQGIRNSCTSNALFSYVMKFSPDVVFLLESKLLASQVPGLARQVGFSNFYCVDRIGLSGGLVLLWKDHVVVRTKFAARFYIDALISSTNVLPWRFSGIYGDPNPKQRKNTWDLLQKLCSMNAGPWIYYEDFNEILDNSEKLGGMEKLQNNLDIFRPFLDICQLQDLGFEGDGCFTWSNGHVFERLDRFFGNFDWLEAYPDYKVKHLDFFYSDHKPILLSFGNNASGKCCGRVKRISRFHFEHAWCEDPGCGDIINSNWTYSLGELGLSGLLDHIVSCESRLESWGKEKFRNLNKEKTFLQDKISSISSLHDLVSWNALKESEKF